MTDYTPAGAIPEDKLTDEQRTNLASLRGQNRQLIDAFSRALESIGMKDAAGKAFRILDFRIDASTMPEHPNPNLCCICCANGTYCCSGTTCEGCCQ